VTVWYDGTAKERNYLSTVTKWFVAGNSVTVSVDSMDRIARELPKHTEGVVAFSSRRGRFSEDF
jgi:hypothetical protein